MFANPQSRLFHDHRTDTRVQLPFGEDDVQEAGVADIRDVDERVAEGLCGVAALT